MASTRRACNSKPSARANLVSCPRFPSSRRIERCQDQVDEIGVERSHMPRPHRVRIWWGGCLKAFQTQTVHPWNNNAKGKAQSALHLIKLALYSDAVIDRTLLRACHGQSNNTILQRHVLSLHLPVVMAVLDDATCVSRQRPRFWTPRKRNWGPIGCRHGRRRVDDGFEWVSGHPMILAGHPTTTVVRPFSLCPSETTWTHAGRAAILADASGAHYLGRQLRGRTHLSRFVLTFQLETHRVDLVEMKVSSVPNSSTSTCDWRRTST